MNKEIRASCWSITINNPIGADEENINLARQKGWKVEGQKEVGENGTPHYQLLVETGQQRFSAVKKAFPRAHIEICRDKVALKKYVHKEDTKVEELASTTHQYPSLQTMWDMFYDWLQLDYNEKKFFEVSPEARLNLFDEFVRESIENGYVLETMGVNPQIRSSIKLYGRAIILRSKSRRQTDRQTDTNNVQGQYKQDGTTSEENYQAQDDEEDEEDRCSSSSSDGTHRGSETDI